MLKKLFGGIFLTVALLGLTFNATADITAQECKAKVLEAAKAIEAEGDAAIAKIADKAGPFTWDNGNGYVWVHDMDGKMIAHPMKPQLNGQNVLDMKDPSGVPLFANMNDLVAQNSSGWVAYSWTKPGSTTASPKVSYVTKAVLNGKTFVVGAGIYDVSKDDIKKQFTGDVIYEE